MDILRSLDDQSDEMLKLVIRWAEINSHTFNPVGLKEMAQSVSQGFQVFGEKVELVDLPALETVNSRGQLEARELGQALVVHKRPRAAQQVLLSIHMDTVYPPDQPFEIKQKGNILNGPGVADAKGGLVILLKALEVFEKSSVKDGLGWTVLINSDEEVGSPGSRGLLQQAAQMASLGLLFEPCLPDGTLVGQRKGSGNFTVVMTGRSAHAGRDHAEGRNTIIALSRCLLKIQELHATRSGLTVNAGAVEGGGAANVVPDCAMARVNVRIEKEEDAEYVQTALKSILDEFSREDGISAKLHGGIFALPKLLTGKTLDLYTSVKACGVELGLDLQWCSTGGVSDGNRLAAFGLPNVDTLGVKGGDIHSPKEYLYIDSLTERAKLTALFMMKLAAGELKF